jgi:hypothetical protein
MTTASGFAKSEIKRLWAMNGARERGPEWEKEIQRTLLAIAVDDSHLSAIVGKILTEEIWAPAPAQIRAIAEMVPIAKEWHPSGERCPLCQGQGRESFWALISTERWHDTGRIRRRTMERIGPKPGHEAYYLQERPDLEEIVDGVNQCVQMVSGYCLCEAGVYLKEIQMAAQSRDGAR